MARWPWQGRSALSLWRDFPVTSRPRPLVLNGSTTFLRGTFRSELEKNALLSGAVESAVDLPAGVLEQLRGTDHRAGRPVVIVGAGRTTATFETDRGPTELPAWLLALRGVDVHLTVLDPTVSRRTWRPPAWPPGRPFMPESRGWLLPDGRTLVFEFMGPTESVAAYPRAEVLSSATAVTVAPAPESPASPGGAVMLVAVPRRVTVRLDEPLGARVLVETNGQPVTVIGWMTSQPASGCSGSYRSTEWRGTKWSLTRSTPPIAYSLPSRAAILNRVRRKFSLAILCHRPDRGSGSYAQTRLIGSPPPTPPPA